MPGDILIAGIVGVSVGAAHGLAHSVAGTEASFDEAGVSAAGITVVIAATAATYILLNPGVVGL